jgi:hypothetical protein
LAPPTSARGARTAENKGLRKLLHPMNEVAAMEFLLGALDNIFDGSIQIRYNF